MATARKAAALTIKSDKGGRESGGDEGDKGIGDDGEEVAYTPMDEGVLCVAIRETCCRCQACGGLGWRARRIRCS